MASKYGNSGNFYDELFDGPPESTYERRTTKKMTTKMPKIGHFIKILGIEPEISKSRRTYSEILDLKLRLKTSEFKNPSKHLERIFEFLLGRLLKSARFKGNPKGISVQVDNKYFDTPFYVPQRPLYQNNPKSLAAALLWLSAQSGGKLRIFKTRTRVKIFGVWPLYPKKTKFTKLVGGKKQKRAQKRMRRYGGGQLNETRWLSTIDKKRRGIIPIENKDKLCLFRAISVGLINAMFGPKMAKELAENAELQKKIALTIMKCAKIRPNLQKYTLQHVNKIQNWLNRILPGQFRLAVFHAESGFRLIYRGRICSKQNICILLNGQHYDFILSTKKLFQSRAEYCLDCKSPAYSNSHNVECRKCCRLCYRFGPNYPCKQPDGQPVLPCIDCQFYFPNLSCFEWHKKRGNRGGQTICETRFYCKKCNKVVYKRGAPHKCNNLMVGRPKIERCEICLVDKAQNFPHHCYIQPIGHSPLKDVRYIFYDIEATQTDRINVNGLKCWRHKPNLLCCEIICQYCMDSPHVNLPAGNVPSLDRALNCVCGVFSNKFRYKWANLVKDNPRLLFFREGPDNPRKNQTVADQFLDFLTHCGERSTQDIILAHNAGKYDLHLLVDAIYARNIQPNLIMTGLKIFSLRMGGSNLRSIIMKDSLNFINGGLSGFYNTFNLNNMPGIEKKPNFPHLYNKMANFGKIRNKLPSLKYYGIKNMKDPERSEFLNWYAQNKNQSFDLATALIDYCRNDVQILREACIRFRRIIKKIAPQVEPFKDASTLARLALNVWRSGFLRPNTFITLPENGLRPKEQQSLEALRFFRLYSKLTGRKVQTAEWAEGEHVSFANGQSTNPMNCGDYRIDGYIPPDRPNEKPTAIEYLGCAFHGCLSCFKNRTECIQGGKTAEDLYERTQRRKAELEARGYNVIDVWSCKFKELLANNPKLRKLWNRIEGPQPPLNPRCDALRGGRVEPFRLYDEVKEDEVIEHFDIVSLYPYVMKACSYPIGEPIVFGPENLATIEMPPLPWYGRNLAIPFKGLLLLRILPPQKIASPSKQQPLPPFLPYRTLHGQLVFPLCAKCADARNGRPCRHDERKRSWIAAFPHEDVKLALELDYKVLEIFEVWHWPTEQWTGKDRDLFRGYINALLKLKVEASGWPENCKTEDQKWEFVREYMAREGIELDPSNIELNKVLRMIAKLLLNSLWGKLCQRANPGRIVITKSPHEFHRLMDDDRIEIMDVKHLNSFLDRVVYRMKAEFIEPPRTNNVAIASMVTANGRRVLYRTFQEAVGKENVLLYCDTDSVIVKRKIHQQSIRQGEFLGDMQKELPGRTIRKWLAGGPKNYAYIHTKEDGSDQVVVRRIRGFELTHRVGRKITFESMLADVKKRFGGGKNIDRAKIKGITVTYTVFRRHKRGMLYTQSVKKTYKAVFEKGIVIPGDLSTRPFGWIGD